jgi:hypothetical protein
MKRYSVSAARATRRYSALRVLTPRVVVEIGMSLARRPGEQYVEVAHGASERALRRGRARADHSVEHFRDVGALEIRRREVQFEDISRRGVVLDRERDHPRSITAASRCRTSPSPRSRSS